MAEFTIRVDLQDDVGVLEWSGQVDEQTLTEAVSLATDDTILGHGLRRVEAHVVHGDLIARRALHRAGFRREGIKRQALKTEEGFLDVVMYARLATDQVYGPGGFSAVMNSVLPTKRVIAHVMFTDDQGRVLLLETTYKTDFELPGGVVEPGESPRDGAVREVSEEIGLLVQLGPPALVDWMPPHLGWSDAIEFIFDGGVLDQTAVAVLTLDPSEIRAAHWLAAEELHGQVSELSARRLQALLEARTAPRIGPMTVFTQNGHPL